MKHFGSLEITKDLTLEQLAGNQDYILRIDANGKLVIVDLSSTTNGSSGADLVGIDVSTIASLTTATTVQGAFEELETYLSNETTGLGAIYKSRDGSNAFTADQDLGGFKLTNLADGVANKDAVTVEQMNTAVANNSVINFNNAKAVITTMPAYTYSNGTSGVGATITANVNGAWNVGNSDDVTLSVNDVVVIPGTSVTSGLSDNAHAGMYTVTQLGDGSNPFVFTRTVPGDESTEWIKGRATNVNYGVSTSVYSLTVFQYQGDSSPTIGTDSLEMILIGDFDTPDITVDNVTIEFDGSNDLSVKDGGITEAKLGSDVDADTFLLSAGYLAAAGTVAISDTVEQAIEKIVGNANALDVRVGDNETDITELTANQNDLITLSGVAENSTNFGTIFTGTTIQDNATISSALQDLETALESVIAGTEGVVISVTGDDYVSASETNGAVTLTTDVNTDATGATWAALELVDAAAIRSYVETITGVAAAATNLGTFTGTTISDNVDIKVALQELEDAVEANTEDNLSYAVTLTSATSNNGTTDTYSLSHNFNLTNIHTFSINIYYDADTTTGGEGQLVSVERVEPLNGNTVEVNIPGLESAGANEAFYVYISADEV